MATETNEAAASARKPSVPGTAARIAALVIALAALAAAAGLWLDARSRIGATQEEVARRLRVVEEEASEARAASRTAQEG
ncbi:MAG: hypothetical protein ACREVQ_10320, partial [Burkholderiales bacterium]